MRPVPRLEGKRSLLHSIGRAAALASLGLVLLAAAVYGLRHGASPSTSSAHDRELAHAEPVSAEAPPCGHPTLGDQLVYAVDVRLALQLPPPQALSVQGTGSLQLTLVSDEDGERIFQGGFADVLWKSEVNGQKADDEAFVQQLARPFGVRLSEENRLTRVYLSPDLDPLAMGLVRYVVAGLQFVRPWSVAEDAGAWEVEEADWWGRYTARYARDEARQFFRSKLRYRPHRTPPAGSAGELESTAVYRISDGKDCVEHAEIVETHSQHDILPTTETSSVTLDLREVRRTEGSSGLDPTLVAFPADAPVMVKSKAVAKPLPPGLTADDLIARLPSDAGEIPWDLTDSLVQLFRERPGEIDRALKALRRSASRNAEKAILGALGDAGSERAQDALADVAESSDFQAGLRRMALLELGLLKTAPTPDTLDALSRISRSSRDDRTVTDLALVALGNASRTVLASEDGTARRDAERTIQSLQQGFARAVTEDDRVLYMDALGNTGSAEILPAAQLALETGGPLLRTAGVGALRLVAAPEADAILVRVAHEDAEAQVRQQALLAMTNRPRTEAGVNTALALLRADASAEVRAVAIAVLEPTIERSDVREALEAAARADASKLVREQATQALSSRR
jgi:hypothetical protein